MKVSKLYVAATNAAFDSIGKTEVEASKIKQDAFLALGLDSHSDWSLFGNMFDSQRVIVIQHENNLIPSAVQSRKVDFAAK